MVPNDASLWTTKEALQMNTWHLQFVIEEFIILFICIRCDTFSYATRKKKNSRQKMNIELVFARILLIVLVLADFGVGFESSLSIVRRTKSRTAPLSCSTNYSKTIIQLLDQVSHSFVALHPRYVYLLSICINTKCWCISRYVYLYSICIWKVFSNTFFLMYLYSYLKNFLKKYLYL